MPSDSNANQAPDFDRVARVYRWAEYAALGPLLQQTRTALLDRLGESRQALLFGDGDGRFLAQLLLQYPSLHATAVDTSGAMLRLLQARCARAGAAARLRTVQASALHIPIPPGINLIVSHFFLDCLTQAEVDQLTRTVAACVPPGTLWLVSDFAVPNKPLLRGLGRLYIRSLYLAFRLLTGLRVRHLPDPQAALTVSGFRRIARKNKLFGLLYSELWILGEPGLEERHNPATPAFIHKPMGPLSKTAAVAGENVQPAPARMAPADPYPGAQPNPEPPAPSLPEPDPGVFHHEPSRGPAAPTGEVSTPGKGF